MSREGHGKVDYLKCATCQAVFAVGSLSASQNPEKAHRHGAQTGHKDWIMVFADGHHEPCPNLFQEGGTP